MQFSPFGLLAMACSQHSPRFYCTRPVFRGCERKRSIPVPQADPRLMEAAALATSGELDAAEELARATLAEKESDAAHLRDVLEGIARRRAAE